MTHFLKNTYYVLGSLHESVRMFDALWSGKFYCLIFTGYMAPGHSVFDNLLEKHPAPRDAIESFFLPCDVLPPLIDLDITVDYVG